MSAESTEREEFEKWAKSQGDSCDRLPCTLRGQPHDCTISYESTFTDWEWKSWQARAALGQKASTSSKDQKG